MESMRKSLLVIEELCRQLYDEYYTLASEVDKLEKACQVKKELE